MGNSAVTALPKILSTQPDLRPQLVGECVDMLNNEVNRKGGASGLLIKGAFKLVKNLQSGKVVYNFIDKLMDDFLLSLDSYFQSFKSADHASFSDYLAQDTEGVANALLKVTDKRRESSSNEMFIKTYDKLRPKAVKNVAESVPALGKVIEKYI